MAIALLEQPSPVSFKLGNQDTMTNIVRFDDFGDEIRVTEDGSFSVYDVIKFCGKKNPRDAWKALTEQYPEIVGKTDNTKFPGKGGAAKPTPVANRENILYIIGLLPGAFGRSYRESAAKVFVQYLDASPELAESIIDRATPEDLKRIQARLDGKKIRVSFTSVLQEHGVKEGWQFAQCTNAIYYHLFDMDAKQLREARNLPAKTPTRDAMDLVELSAVALAEALAERTIKSEDRQGYRPCRDACEESGQKVRKAID